MNIKPVVPFEPISSTANTLPNGNQWIAQIKWDGVRMLTYYDGNKVRLVNRRLNDRTEQYPELAIASDYCSASSFVLDGELIAFDANKPSFQEIMKRDSLRNKQSIEIAVTRVPVTYMVFDVLYLNGEWVVARSLAERQQLLKEILKPLPYVRLVDNFADAEGLFEVVKAHRMEGIVAKNLESKYAIDGKDSRWQKFKLNYDLYAAIGGVTYRDKVVNSLLLGVYSDNSFIYIGHAGTGKLNGSDWRALTERIEPLIVADNPFSTRPERYKDAKWIEPGIVVKVQFMEWTRGGTMRQPSIQSIVDSLPLDVCSYDQIIR